MEPTTTNSNTALTSEDHIPSVPDSDGGEAGLDIATLMKSFREHGGDADDGAEYSETGEPVEHTSEGSDLSDEDPAPKKTGTKNERIRQKYEARVQAKKEAQLAQRVAELEAERGKPLTPAQVNEAARKLLAEKRTPEELAAEKQLQEFEDLKAWKAQVISEKQEQRAASERAEEVAYVASLLEESADDHPYLASSGWSNEFVHEKVEEFLDPKSNIVDPRTGAKFADVHQVLSYLDEGAKSNAQSFVKNKRSLKVLLADESHRSVVLEVLQEMGLTPTAAKSAVRDAMKKAPPKTLNNAMKTEGVPFKDEENDDPDSRYAATVQWVRDLKRANGGRI